MAATDELPRGWVFSQLIVTPSFPFISIPAIQGVSHVLTSAELSAATGGGGAAQQVVLETGTGIILALVFLTGPSALADGSWSGKIAAAAGGALTVTTNQALGVATVATLTIAGYDI